MAQAERWRDELALSVDDPTHHISSSPQKSPVHEPSRNLRSATRRSNNRKSTTPNLGSASKQNTQTKTTPSCMSSTFHVGTPNESREGMRGSPVRFRLTVTADPDGDMSTQTSPAVRRSRTTTVPVKNEDGPSRPMRRRGKPWKSDASLLHGTTEPSTEHSNLRESSQRSPPFHRPPTPARLGPVVEEEQMEEVRIDEGLVVKRRKHGSRRSDAADSSRENASTKADRRTRARLRQSIAIEEDLIGELGGSIEMSEYQSGATAALESDEGSAAPDLTQDMAESQPRRQPSPLPRAAWSGARQPSPQAEIDESPPDPSSAAQHNQSKSQLFGQDHTPEERDIWAPTPQPRTRVQLDDHRGKTRIADSADEGGAEEHAVEEENLEQGGQSDLEDHEPPFYPEQSSSPLGSPVVNEVAFDLEGDDEDVNPITMDDDTAALDRSAHESEGFSMVSIDSLRHHKRLAEQEAARAQSEAEHLAAEEEQSRLEQIEEEHEQSRLEQDLEAGQEASPLRTSVRNRAQTPPVQRSSTQSPPPLHSSPQHQSSKKMSPAVRAGSVLQEALSSPAGAQSTSPRPARQTTPSRHEVRNLFRGFGDASQKALRRSIAMGELLAREEQVMGLQPFMDVPSAQPTVMYPRLPTPEDSQGSGGHRRSAESLQGTQRMVPEIRGTKRGYEEMSWRPTTTETSQAGGDLDRNKSQHSTDAMSWKATTPPKPRTKVTEAESAAHALRQEQIYQSEREQVIRDAHRSQQIMIDSDDDHSSASHDHETSTKARGKLVQRDQDGDELMRDASMRGSSLRDARPQSRHDERPAANETAGTNLDVWQEEADRSLEDSMEGPRRKRTQRTPASSSLRQAFVPQARVSLMQGELAPSIEEDVEDDRLPEKTPDFRDLLGEDDQPIRGKLPRTWRQGGRNQLLYSDESGDTPAKSEQAQRLTFNAGRKHQYDTIPSVLKRAQRPSSDDAGGPSPTKPAPGRRSILHSPRRRQSPLSSPPKEVRFDEGTRVTRASRAPSRMDHYADVHDEDVNEEEVRDVEDGDLRESDYSEDDEEASPSRLEPGGLLSPSPTHSPPSSPPISRSALTRLSKRPSNLPNLFDTFPPPPAGAAPPSRPPLDLRSSAPPETPSGPSFLTQLTSLAFFPFTFFFPSSWSSGTIWSRALGDAEWSVNHALLLAHYSDLARHKLVYGPRLPTDFLTRALPRAYRRMIGKRFSTLQTCSDRCKRGADCPYQRISGQRWDYELCERDVRVIYLFISEVADRGVPLLRGDDGEGDEPVRKPLTEADAAAGRKRGRVERRKETWTPNFVAQELFNAHADEWAKLLLIDVLRNEEESSRVSSGAGD